MCVCVCERKELSGSCKGRMLSRCKGNIQGLILKAIGLKSILFFIHSDVGSNSNNSSSSSSNSSNSNNSNSSSFVKPPEYIFP